MAGIVIAGSSGCAGKKTKDAAVFISAAPVQLSGGWGYKIELNHRPYIYQNQIPCLPGKQLFPTRESAMALAHIVVERMEHGQAPTVSKEDLKKLALLPPGD